MLNLNRACCCVYMLYKTTVLKKAGKLHKLVIHRAFAAKVAIQYNGKSILRLGNASILGAVIPSPYDRRRRVFPKLHKMNVFKIENARPFYWSSGHVLQNQFLGCSCLPSTVMCQWPQKSAVIFYVSLMLACTAVTFTYR